VAPDYKDIKIIGRFVTERGKIVPRRLSGVSAKNQRLLAAAVKRARPLGMLPFVAENMR
jgi:small subunit ribosomal protein S18